MKKNLIIKIGIVFVVLILSYCVFWFFKIGQAEKQINRFVNENSAYISVGSFAVSGFPLSQKISIKDLKITLPLNVTSKRQIILSEIESVAGIFSNDFATKIIGAVKLQDLNSPNDVYDLEFLGETTLNFSLNEGIIQKFIYSDKGFKILDANKNIVNSTSSNSFTADVSVGDGDKTSVKVSINSNDISGYTLLDFYKNVLDKKVIEGIKTDEIKINLTDNSQALGQNISVNDLNNVAINDPNQVALAINSSLANNPSNVAQPSPANPAESNMVAPNLPNPIPGNQAPVPSVIPASEQPVMVNGTNNVNPNLPPQVPASNEQIPNQPPVVAPQQPANNVVNPSEPNNIIVQKPTDSGNLPVSPTQASSVKYNLALSFTINTTPTINQDLPTPPPSDPTQIQELPVQFIKNIKIDNFEFSTQRFKFNALGDFNISSDDNYPSGSIAIKIENIDQVISLLKLEFMIYAELKKPPIVDGPNINIEAQNKYVPNYDIFLTNISNKIQDVALEVGSKNSVTKDRIAQFDIRREKNLEFLVNEMPIREIVGKFTN